jgi:hypothetical protein
MLNKKSHHHISLLQTSGGALICSGWIYVVTHPTPVGCQAGFLHVCICMSEAKSHILGENMGVIAGGACDSRAQISDIFMSTCFVCHNASYKTTALMSLYFETRAVMPHPLLHPHSDRTGVFRSTYDT